MSIRIIKAGILDTIQDTGRYGYQYMGIAPGGAMDVFSAKLVNILCGNDENAPVIEMHYPAAVIFFERDAVIAIGGADFTPVLNGDTVPLLHPILVKKNSLLECRKSVKGSRCYVAINPTLSSGQWLDSYSTNLKAKAGGWQGRSLQKDDVLPMQQQVEFLTDRFHNDFMVLPFSPDLSWQRKEAAAFYVLAGPEWDQVPASSQRLFLQDTFSITTAADRMGYRLQGAPLAINNSHPLVSSPVTFGSIQLLPDGQLIILMADHQTTGGYPRIATVVTTSLPLLAQSSPGDALQFEMIDQQQAEKLFMCQQELLQQIKDGCQLQLPEYFKSLPNAEEND